jgi:hypothetical protein
MQVGDEVRASGEVQGTIQRIFTDGAVYDPLLGEVLDAAADDPVLMLETDDGPAAVLASEAKAVPALSPESSGWDALVGLLAEHELQVETKGLPPWSRPDGAAVKVVYGRGLRSWPGADATVLSQTDWALGRARAFLATSSGQQMPGYVRDADMLPDGHPAREGTAPA